MEKYYPRTFKEAVIRMLDDYKQDKNGDVVTDPKSPNLMLNPKRKPRKDKSNVKYKRR